MNQDPIVFCSGFSRSPEEHISIVDGYETERIPIKEDIPGSSERQDDVIEPKEEYHSDGMFLRILLLMSINQICLLFLL